VIGVESHRKTVRHLEGGIVAEILIREGSEVAAGEVLVRLDETQTRATLGRLRAQLHAAAARAARLVAERDGAEEVTFPAWLEDLAAEPGVAGVLAGERRLRRPT
jgi:HlyD family secretion protein